MRILLHEVQALKAPEVAAIRALSASFTFNMPMVRAVRGPGPAHGVIDVLGPPW